MHLLVTDTFKKGWGVDQKTSQYLMCPPFASYSVTHLLRIELIRLLIVACGMLSHSASMAVRSCWILAGTGTRCRTCWSKASQTCSMGYMSSEYAGHRRTRTFSASRNCVLKNEVTAADEWHDNGPQDLSRSSLRIKIAINKMQLYSLSVVYACPYQNPTATMGNSVHKVDISKLLAHTAPSIPITYP